MKNANKLGRIKSTPHWYLRVYRSERRFPSDPRSVRVDLYQRRTGARIDLPAVTLEHIAQFVREAAADLRKGD